LNSYHRMSLVRNLVAAFVESERRERCKRCQAIRMSNDSVRGATGAAQVEAAPRAGPAP